MMSPLIEIRQAASDPRTLFLARNPHCSARAMPERHEGEGPTCSALAAPRQRPSPPKSPLNYSQQHIRTSVERAAVCRLLKKSCKGEDAVYQGHRLGWTVRVRCGPQGTEESCVLVLLEMSRVSVQACVEDIDEQEQVKRFA